jgi:hypothetical protein
MADPKIPPPAAMPVDKLQWLSQLHLSNFHNAYYEFRDVQRCIGSRGKLLVVGVGQGLDVTVFRSRGYDVTSYDIDPDFGPDRVGSVHDMSCFADDEFDAAVASHVLEHMSLSLLDSGLRELSRVARHAIVYLPYAGRHLDLSFTQFQGSFEHHWRVNVPPFWRRPSPEKPLFAGGQHFWEVGLRGCSRRAIRRRMEQYFEVVSMYQNPHWLVSMNFVLRSRRARRAIV